MKLLPVALNIENKRCLVVGGGPVAERKVRALLECGACVTVVAPQLCDGLAALCEHIEHRAQRIDAGDCKIFKLVFACTDDRATNAAIAEEARWFGIWCSVADDAGASDFHTAATLRRGEVCVGVTTGGGSPALARHIKARLEESIGPEYAELLEIVSAQRSQLKESVEHQSERAGIWRAILNSDALPLLRQGNRVAAEWLVAQILQAPPSREQTAPGERTAVSVVRF